MTMPSLSSIIVKGKTYQYLQFSTKSFKEWNKIYNIFYKDGVKVIPGNKIIENLLTPSFAELIDIWEMAVEQVKEYI